MKNVDLHCHSTCSDGMLTPSDLVARAHQCGVDVLALTDHDELSGLALAAETAHNLGMGWIPGVEISVSWGDLTVHVVGVRINPEDPALMAGVAQVRTGRDERAHEMARKLESLGIPDCYEGAMRFVSNPNLISRAHFARHLVAAGVCQSMNQTFERYLGENKPAYVANEWARLSDAIDWIRQSGGQAVLAHAGRYRINETALHALVQEFTDLGGAGIEVVSGSQSPSWTPRLADMAQRYGLLGSRGSDFHGPDESQFDLGGVPHLPANVKPIWHDW